MPDETNMTAVEQQILNRYMRMYAGIKEAQGGVAPDGATVAMLVIAATIRTACNEEFLVRQVQD